jgi:hypothetical protein
MAVYYWTGAVSADPNNLQNWTLWWQPGATFFVSATSKPVWGSDIRFVKWATSGAQQYPIFGPSGTLTGTAGNPSSTLGIRYLNSVKIDADYEKNIGTSTDYFVVSPSNVIFDKAANGWTACYLHTTTLFNGADPVITPQTGAEPSASVYLKGVGQFIESTTATPSKFNFYLYNFDGSVKVYNTLSSSTYNFDTTSQIANDMIINGQSSRINITKGFALQNDGILRMNNGTLSTQSLYFTAPGICGSSGPSELTSTTMKLVTSGTNVNSQSINVDHGVDFADLQMNSGTINFGNVGQNDGCRILQGTMLATTCRMNISDTADVSILAPFSGNQGFAIKSDTTNVMPIYFKGNYKISANDTTYSYPGGGT